MRNLLRFLSDMDAQAWRALVVSVVLFGGVGLVFVFGSQVFGFGGETTVERWLGAASGLWSLPAAVAAFTILAFVGVPQIMLIAAAVVVFGPWTGLAYSWIGTMVSALIGFRLGQVAGARTLTGFSTEGLRQFMALVGRNGFVTSLIVRLVPSAPFIIVNMAAGMTPMRLADFAAGTALGVVPKIALTAFAGNSIVRVLRGEGGLGQVLLLVVVGALWLAIGWYARKWLNSRERAR